MPWSQLVQRRTGLCSSTNFSYNNLNSLSFFIFFSQVMISLFFIFLPSSGLIKFMYVVTSNHSATPATDAWSLCHGHTKCLWHSHEHYLVLSNSKEKVVGHYCHHNVLCMSHSPDSIPLPQLCRFSISAVEE